MLGEVLLVGGAASIAVAIAVGVFAAIPSRSRPVGVSAALVAIEKTYSPQPRSTSRAASSQRAALPGWAAVLALRLSTSSATSTLQRRLDLAGNPPAWTTDRILAVKGLGMLALGALFSVYGLHSVALLILCAFAGGLAGFFLPNVLLYNSGQKRQARIRAALPDAVDLLTVCMEAGLGFDAALGQVARNTQTPLAAEFARALQEIQIGKSRTQALRAMVGRTTVPELRTFVSALVQASELGIAISQVLKEQAKEMRLRRRQRAEELAQQVSVKILFPLICCLFPALFIFIIGPGAISIAHSLLGI